MLAFAFSWQVVAPLGPEPFISAMVPFILHAVTIFVESEASEWCSTAQVDYVMPPSGLATKNNAPFWAGKNQSAHSHNSCARSCIGCVYFADDCMSAFKKYAVSSKVPADFYVCRYSIYKFKHYVCVAVWSRSPNFQLGPLGPCAWPWAPAP